MNEWMKESGSSHARNVLLSTKQSIVFEHTISLHLAQIIIYYSLYKVKMWLRIVYKMWIVFESLSSYWKNGSKKNQFYYYFCNEPKNVGWWINGCLFVANVNDGSSSLVLANQTKEKKGLLNLSLFVGFYFLFISLWFSNMFVHAW